MKSRPSAYAGEPLRAPPACARQQEVAGGGRDGEERPVLRPEVERPVHEERRRLRPRAHAERPADRAVGAAQAIDAAAERAHVQRVGVEGGGGGERRQHVPDPDPAPGARGEGQHPAVVGLDVDPAVVHRRRELDEAAEALAPDGAEGRTLTCLRVVAAVLGVESPFRPGRRCRLGVRGRGGRGGRGDEGQRRAAPDVTVAVLVDQVCRGRTGGQEHDHGDAAEDEPAAASGGRAGHLKAEG